MERPKYYEDNSDFSQETYDFLLETGFDENDIDIDDLNMWIQE